MQEIGRLMTTIYGISLTQMMENAGFNLALLAKKMSGGSVLDKNICITVGGGNKGGTGLVCARHLSNWGAEVTCLLVKSVSDFNVSAAQQLETVRHLPVSVVAMGMFIKYIEWDKCRLIIDAMIGAGLHGEPDTKVSHVIDHINATQGRVLSLDTPSGLNPCTGYVCESTVQADSTLTLALPKQGLLKPEARHYVREIYLGDISVPPLLYRQLGLCIDQSVFRENTIVPYQI